MYMIYSRNWYSLCHSLDCAFPHGRKDRMSLVVDFKYQLVMRVDGSAMRTMMWKHDILGMG